MLGAFAVETLNLRAQLRSPIRLFRIREIFSELIFASFRSSSGNAREKNIECKQKQI